MRLPFTHEDQKSYKHTHKKNTHTPTYLRPPSPQCIRCTYFTVHPPTHLHTYIRKHKTETMGWGQKLCNLLQIEEIRHAAWPGTCAVVFLKIPINFLFFVKERTRKETKPRKNSSAYKMTNDVLALWRVIICKSEFEIGVSNFQCSRTNLCACHIGTIVAQSSNKKPYGKKDNESGSYWMEHIQQCNFILKFRSSAPNSLQNCVLFLDHICPLQFSRSRKEDTPHGKRGHICGKKGQVLWKRG